METTTIGTALSRRRSDLGIDQKDAAALIGMSRTSFSSYERDLQRPSAEVLPALAKFLEVTIEEILTLYGATSIEALRPSLERLLATRELSIKAATSSDFHAAEDEPSIQDDDFDEPETRQRDESTEASVSIFANELSDGMAPLAKAAFAISPSQDVQPVADVATGKTKKKKKKKRNKK